MAQAKVFANVFTRKRGATNGTISFTVEFLLVQGDVRSGKAILEVSNLANETAVQTELKEGLVDYLNTLYSPEVFRERDIVGLSV